MTARPKTRHTKRTPITSAKKTAAKRRLPTRGDRVAMRAALASIAVNRKPQLEPIPCTTAPSMTSGTEALDNAYTKQTPADMVLLICYGIGLGLGVPVTYTKTASGWSFEGWRPGCYIEKCSNGQQSKEALWIAGTIDANAAPQTLKFEYEHHSLCGEELTCIETGTYAGEKVSSGSELRQADWRGTMTWQRSCCPDQEWKFSVAPPPPSPGIHGRTAPGPRSGPKTKTKAKKTRAKGRRVAKRVG